MASEYNMVFPITRSQLLNYSIKMEKAQKIKKIVDDICKQIESKVKIYINPDKGFNVDNYRVAYGLQGNPEATISNGDTIEGEIVAELRTKFVDCYIEAPENGRYVIVSWQ